MNSLVSFLLIISGILIPFISCAQFFDENSSWLFDNMPLNFGDDYGQKLLTVEKNETFDNFSLVHFKTKELLIKPNTQTGGSDTVVLNKGFSFTIKDSVVYYEKNYVWFNYKLRKNDTITFSRRIDDAPDSLVSFMVDSIFYNEFNHKCWLLSFIGDSISTDRQGNYDSVVFWHLIFNEQIGFISNNYEINGFGESLGGISSIENFIPFYNWSFRIDQYSTYSLLCYKNWKTGHRFPSGCDAEFMAVKPHNQDIEIKTKQLGSSLKIIIPENVVGTLQIINLDGKTLAKTQVSLISHEFHFEMGTNPILILFTNGQVCYTKKIVPGIY